jgi:hypothetical protein
MRRTIENDELREKIIALGVEITLTEGRIHR